MSDQGVSIKEAFKAAGLKQRIITAAVIAVIFITTVVWLPLLYFQIAMGILFLIAAWEWASLSGLDKPVQKTIYVWSLLLLVGLLQLLTQVSFFTAGIFTEGKFFYWVWIEWLAVIAVLFWLFAFVLVALYPRSTVIFSTRIVRMLMGFLVLTTTWASVIFLKQQHEPGGLILLVVAMIACADIGAYFVGVRFGKHKLASSVSPGKSWEGVIGAVLCNALLVLPLAVYWHLNMNEVVRLFLVTVIVIVFSIIGDLFESMLKRHCGIKDSGTILPGHGGILDRIDGWMAAVPVFTLAYIVFAS